MPSRDEPERPTPPGAGARLERRRGRAAAAAIGRLGV
ncbi:MAG: hypothetical protein QOE44_434, partial [Solirubrobacteraceae bacterium]|nr:hypothetical protein [Solirubrobacteraceae bacterium]